MKNFFEELSDVNVSENVDKKGNLNYLSWMWAWIELKKRYPLSYATVHETNDGMLVWRDPIGCHVKTSVTIVWDEDDGRHEHTVTEYLPVMDFKNQSVPYDKVDSMMVNKTVQRSLTKCIARLGLGSYLFVGEDLPESVTKADELKNEIQDIVKKKCALSDGAKAKVAEICKAAEKQADPELDDESITGNYRNIEDVDALTNLKKRLMAVRK